jgi:hypothetical protein
MARPLDRHSREGKRYTRPPNIEAALDVALAQDVTTWRRRARVTDESSSEYLPPECLVGLIREARRRGDKAAMNSLLDPLLRRCGATLLKKVPGSVPNAAKVREEILSQLALLFAEDATPKGAKLLDFYEVRFNAAFRALRVDVVRAEEARAESEDSFVDQDEDETESEGRRRLASALQRAKQEDQLLEDDLLTAIGTLPADERRAVIICHVLGYPEESDDPNVETAAKRCGVTGRTIRNRLTRAAEKLAKYFKEEE